MAGGIEASGWIAFLGRVSTPERLAAVRSFTWVRLRGVDDGGDQGAGCGVAKAARTSGPGEGRCLTYRWASSLGVRSRAQAAQIA